MSAYPNNIALNLKNCYPCKGLVDISASIFSDSQCRSSKIPSSKYCLTKKCRNKICLVLSLVDPPFLTRWIAAVLSSWITIIRTTSHVKVHMEKYIWKFHQKLEQGKFRAIYIFEILQYFKTFTKSSKNIGNFFPPKFWQQISSNWSIASIYTKFHR